MKQLDVDVSPPVFVWTPYLFLPLVTFDLDLVSFDSRFKLLAILYFLRYELLSSLNFGPVTDGCKAMHMSPLCRSTSALHDLVYPPCKSRHIGNY